MLLLILGHIYANHRVLVVEQEHRERASKLGLPNACRSQEDERTDRSIRVLEPRSRANYGIGDRADRLAGLGNVRIRLDDARLVRGESVAVPVDSPAVLVLRHDDETSVGQVAHLELRPIVGVQGPLSPMSARATGLLRSRESRLLRPIH